MADFNHLKDWLVPLLKERHLSVEDLAKKSGLSRAAIYAWYIDRNRPDDETISKVVRVLSESQIAVNGKLITKEVTLHEAHLQYTPRPEGRSKGSSGGARAVAVRTRR